MKFHIVQVNEKIKDISKKYNVSVDEIIKNNRHINNIENIVPGMKLKLPILVDEVSDSLKDNYLDIEKYYPKLEDFKEVKLEKKLFEENENQNEQDSVTTPQINVIPQNSPIQQPHQQYNSMPPQQYYQQPNYQYNPQMYPQYPQMHPNQFYQQPQYPQMNYNPYFLNRQNELKTNIKSEQSSTDQTILPSMIDTSKNIKQEIQEQPNYQPFYQNSPVNVPNQTNTNEQPHILKSNEIKKQATLEQPINQPYYYQNPPINVPNQTSTYEQPVSLQPNENKKDEKRKPYPFNEEIEQPKVMIDKKLGYEFYPSINQPYYYQQQINSQIASPMNLNSQNKDEVLEFDEHVKAIKVDLRDAVKHTKIRKKPKDPLDLL